MQLSSDQYKPPMLLLMYDVPISNSATLGVTNIGDLLLGALTDKSIKIGNTNLSIPGLNINVGGGNLTQGSKIGLQKLSLPGLNFQSGNINLGLDNVVSSIKSIKSTNVNNSLDYKSSTTKSGLNKVTVTDAKNYLNPVTGWAWIRCKAYGNSLLPDSSDTRPHILLRKVPPGSPGDVGAVIWVKQSTTPKGVIPVPGSPDYTKRTANYEKFLKGKSATYFDFETGKTTLVDSGNNQFRILILEDSALSITSKYCVVQYYTGFDTTKKGTEIVCDEVVPPKEDIQIDGNILNKNSNLEGGKDTYTRYLIDFYRFSHYPNRQFGFGIEQFNFSGDSRKSVQQTRGTYSKDVDPSNNFYVDTWGKGPEQISLVGVMELPYAYDSAVVTQKISTGEGYKDYKSFMDTIEEFFSWNNHPDHVNAGETLKLIDYYKQITYTLSFKSRKFTQSVERQSMIAFELSFIVLSKTEGVEEYRK